MKGESKTFAGARPKSSFHIERVKLNNNVSNWYK